MWIPCVGTAVTAQCAAVQNQITEASVGAERSLAAALQHLDDAIGLPEWAGQVVTNSAGEQWYGGVVLRPSNVTGVLASSQSQEIEPGLQRIMV